MTAASSHEDRIVAEVLAGLGPWSNEVVIGGGFAPIIYRLYLASGDVGKPPVGTRDVDTLIPRKTRPASPVDIAQHLIAAGFKPRFKDLSVPATEAFAKVVDGEEIEIEFLTDDSARTDKDKNVTIAGVTAQPLSYLKMSLLEPLEFKTTSGLSGRVVTPAAWIFHKGLTFPRRPSPSKRLKDLYGIWYVATQLGDFSASGLHAFGALKAQRATWFSTFRENLESWIAGASNADLRALEQQDPHGALKELGFKSACRLLGCRV